MSGNGCYGLVAEFADAGQLLEATRRARREGGYTRIEVYSPFPIEELDDVLEHTRDRVPLMVLAGAIFGGVGTFAMEWYSAVVDYPINVGGRPDNSWQAFLPPAIEMTLLFAAVFGIVGMLVFNGLPRLHHPLFDVKAFERVSDDRFFLVLHADDPCFEPEKTRAFLDALSPLSITEAAS
ncbi:MAG TPA: DUF3341 domain-containing protein [Rhodanobacteraceae bacterium]|nr:DUF3341 domain-containing protein [Rhodanobacteraceae bacterium]